MRHWIRIAVGLVALGLAAGCAQSGRPSTGASLRQEETQSRRALSDLERRDRILAAGPTTRYIDEIAARIARQRPEGAPPLRVFVVKDGDVNAFTTGAGYVFLNAGLIAVLENEAQLANVIAHEAAHVDRGHVAAGMDNRTAVGLGATALAIGAAVLGVPADLAQAGAGVGAQAVSAGFTREQEADADAVGFRYLSGAGYNAVAGARSFAVLRRLYGDGGGFFATHPESSERQRTIAALARREGADSGRVAAEEYLRRTEKLRRAALDFYRKEGRAVEARQSARNLRRTR